MSITWICKQTVITYTCKSGCTNVLINVETASTVSSFKLAGVKKTVLLMSLSCIINMIIKMSKEETPLNKNKKYMLRTPYPMTVLPFCFHKCFAHSVSGQGSRKMQCFLLSKMISLANCRLDTEHLCLAARSI